MKKMLAQTLSSDNAPSEAISHGETAVSALCVLPRLLS